MKVLAINGSPRMKTSSTYHVLKPLLEGMESAGAQTEILHVRQLDLNACIGCYNCWVRTPGQCVFDDPMAEAIRKYNEAELIIYGTPLYHFSMSGILKTFIDRLLPRYEPWLIPHRSVAGMSGHPERWLSPQKRMLLVSPCGFPELENFEALVATFKQLARMENLEYVGEILRPFAEPLSRNDLQGLFTGYYELLRQAGVQLIKEGRISPELQAGLGQDLFPGGTETAYKLSDGYWTEQMDRFRVPQEQRHMGPLLARDLNASAPEADLTTTEREVSQAEHTLNATVVRAMAGMYNASVIPDLRATVQLHFIPPENGFDLGPPDWFLVIEPEGVETHQGRTPFPTVDITTPHELWRDVGLGRVDPAQAFIEGRYEAQGSMRLLQQFPNLFAYPRASDIKSALATDQAASPSDSTTQPRTGSEERAMDMRNLSFRETIAGMAAVFNAAAAGDLKTDIQFCATGDEPGNHYLRIEDGQSTFHEGESPSPGLTIHTPSQVWLAISRDELDGQQAFMEGKYRAEGDFSILMKMSQLFRRR